MAPELLLEAVPNDGARFSPCGELCAGVQYDSVRLIRCSRGSTTGWPYESEEDIDDIDLRSRGIRDPATLELSVVELGVEVTMLGVKEARVMGTLPREGEGDREEL